MIAMLMCQLLKLVDCENVTLFRIRHAKSVLSLMLTFVKIYFTEFNKFLDYFIFICRLLFIIILSLIIN